MSLLESIILGVIQGLTEFLPISSSGHLVLGQYLLGLEEPRLLFDIILHVGTLVAVVAYYRRDVAHLLIGIRDGANALVDGDPAVALESTGTRLLLLIAVASLPTALLGAAIDTWLNLDRSSSAAVVFVCIALLVNGFVLLGGRFARDEAGPGSETQTAGLQLWGITPKIALIVGIAQGIAVLPGLSRSGLTITTALLLAVWRTEAARFSFLMSIPAILGALALKFEPGVFGAEAGSGVLAVTAGATAAGIVGYVAILYLERTVADATFHRFSWYCWAVGLAGLAGVVLV
jgi:undecaprenyl-diphosphatase